MEDGCGGTCACPADVSCMTCPLRLVRVDQVDAAGTAASATIALDSSAAWGAAQPRLAEIVVAADAPVVLERLEVGDALAAAGKRVYRYPATNLPFERVDDRTWRLMVTSPGRNLPIMPGRWLTLHFARAGSAWAQGPLSFHLVRAEKLVAPEEANAALSATPFDSPVVIQARR